MLLGTLSALGLLLLLHVPRLTTNDTPVASSRYPSSHSTVDAAAAAKEVHKVAMLKHLLPGTNFSQLASAVALDSAAAAGMSHQQVREMMNFHQELFCM